MYSFNHLAINFTGKHNNGYEAPINKLVFMVVDGMRFNYFTDLFYLQSMPFLNEILQSKEGLLLHSKAEAPTVTLPRIKVSVHVKMPN